jgi:hypothetical protein
MATATARKSQSGIAPCPGATAKPAPRATILGGSLSPRARPAAPLESQCSGVRVRGACPGTARTSAKAASPSSTARRDLAASGKAIFCANLLHATPPTPMLMALTPTIAPVMACVVETGRPVRVAKRTQPRAPRTIASAAGPMWTPRARNPKPALNVTTSARAALAESAAPLTVQRTAAHGPPIISHAAAEQLAAGSPGLTVAKVGEAEVFADGGIADLFIAYPLWGDAAQERGEHVA